MSDLSVNHERIKNRLEAMAGMTIFILAKGLLMSYILLLQFENRVSLE